ncbi:MAG: hypothetical protein ACOCZ5_01470, partial [bacterium]
MKKLLLLFLGLFMMVGMVSAAPFNLPTEWILQPNGTTIDSNSNGWPDYADNALNASSAGDANTLGGELPSYYLDYDNMDAGSIPDEYIDSASTWNAKGGTGSCADGYYVSEVNTTGVVCSLDEGTSYDAGAYLELSGTTFSVDIDNLGPALENSVLLSYHNITDIPVCSGTDKLTYDGTTLTCEEDRNTNTQLSEEQVQDFAWNVLGGTQDGITVTYNDASNTVDFVVDPTATVSLNVSDIDDVSLNNLANSQALVYNSTSGFWENEDVAVDLSNYYTKTEVNNLDVSTFNNDAGYISDYVVTNDDLTGLNNSYLNNDAGYLTDYTETDPVWISEKGNYYTSTEVNNLDVSTFNNDAGYISDYVVTNDDLTG